MIKVMEIEIDEKQLVNSLCISTKAEELSETTHLPLDVCKLITGAYEKGLNEYFGKYFAMQDKYRALTEKVCEKLM